MYSLTLFTRSNVLLYSHCCQYSVDNWTPVGTYVNSTIPFGSCTYSQLSLSPHVSCGNLQRCSKHLIYCLIKQRAGNLSVLVELWCRTHCQCCHHVVGSRNSWHRSVSKSFYLLSLNTHTHARAHVNIITAVNI